MLKVMGIVCILTASIGLGFYESRELTRHEEDLKQIRQMVLLLKGEISFGNLSLDQTFLCISDKIQGIYGEFLRMTAKKMRLSHGKRFGEIYRQCAEEVLKPVRLSREERERLYSLGEYLGYLDQDMQIRQMELYEQELERSIEEFHLQMAEKKKVYQNLGVFGGILLAVLVW